MSSAKAQFNWQDPFLLDAQLTDDERMVREAASAYCQERLAPRVVEAFRSALARDKTRTQVFDISELGLVEMTRKRIGEGLLVNFADRCPECDGRGLVIDHALLE